MLRVVSGTAAFTVGDTITGATSKATAIMAAYVHTAGIWGSGTEAGYLLAYSVSGTFGASEIITGAISGSATTNGTTVDYVDESGKPYYVWAVLYSNVKCRLFYANVRESINTVKEPGEVKQKFPKIILPAGYPISGPDNRIVTTNTGFSGTYDIVNSIPVGGESGIDHYEGILKEAA
jgi:hypothetical protein